MFASVQDQEARAVDNDLSANQRFISDLFTTGANAYVDSQYARNYQPNDVRNYNAGRPAGVSTAAVLADSKPLLLVGGLVVIVALYLITRR